MACRRRQCKAAVAALVSLFVLAALLAPDPPRRHLAVRARKSRRRRAARADPDAAGVLPPPYRWARERLRPLDRLPNGGDTALFWHINKSGGTTAKGYFECLGLTLASRAGALPQLGHHDDAALAAFRPWPRSPASYVNVDTSTPAGILRAGQRGLVASGLADVIVTSHPDFAAEQLFDLKHRGRAFALFRHPVERLVSKFYYLQTASWERTYRPDWQHWSVTHFARVNKDNNYMVKKLAGKKMNERVTEEHLRRAMETLSRRFVVGLTDRMEESMRRFDVLLGVDDSAARRGKCRQDFFGRDEKRRNANPHPQVEEGSSAWNVFAKRNDLDLRLYAHVLELFEKQRDVVADYAAATAGSRAAGPPRAGVEGERPGPPPP